jgi:hypothetical protein
MNNYEKCIFNTAYTRGDGSSVSNLDHFKSMFMFKEVKVHKELIRLLNCGPRFFCRSPVGDRDLVTDSVLDFIDIFKCWNDYRPNEILDVFDKYWPLDNKCECGELEDLYCSECDNRVCGACLHGIEEIYCSDCFEEIYCSDCFEALSVV